MLFKKSRPLEQITQDQGSQFVEVYYSGRGTWNEQTETLLYPSDGTTPVQVLKQDASKVKEYFNDYAKNSVFKMPELPQFDPQVCLSHAAQCCWPRDRQANDNNGNCATEYDTNCIDKDPGDNTDLCYNELSKAPYSNDIEASGFSVYQQEGPIHCHGFAWSTDENEVTSRFKANDLFFVSMYDHMHQRGYAENIPGSPMCGCVEHVSWLYIYIKYICMKYKVLNQQLVIIVNLTFLVDIIIIRCQLYLVQIVRRLT